MSFPSAEVAAIQIAKLNTLLEVAKRRPFYESLLNDVELPVKSLDQLRQIPTITKEDLLPVADASVSDTPPENFRNVGEIFELPRKDYSRFHQTSGTQGYPMVVLDTADDWQWWLRCWDAVLDAASVTEEDVALMAFSFGPFIGFWTANDALVNRGALVVPTGGLSSEARLHLLDEQGCTVVCCTPTYALHLAQVAHQIGMPLRDTAVSRIIVAGEPGGSIASIRRRIEDAWHAQVVDHAGGSEIGAWGFGSVDGKGLHVLETEFIAEVMDFDQDHLAGTHVGEGQIGELVLTNLGRLGGPAIRYRTGDMVRGRRHHDYDVPYLWLDGGVLGRADDMVVVRGVNIFPSSIEAIIRELTPDSEFRILLTKVDEMDQLSIQLEGGTSLADRLIAVLKERLTMRIEVAAVEPGSLPRFEAKAKRVIDHQ